MRLKKYRIVTDNNRGFQCEIWRLYLPFWFQINFVNSHSTIEDAEKSIKNYKKVVKKL